MPSTKQLERVEVRLPPASPQPPLIITPNLAAAVESLINVNLPDLPNPSHLPILILFQANPKLATQKDDDDRLPIHWAVSYNHLPIVELLVSRKDFDPDVQVLVSPLKWGFTMYLWAYAGFLWLDAIDDSFESTRCG